MEWHGLQRDQFYLVPLNTPNEQASSTVPPGLHFRVDLHREVRFLPIHPLLLQTGTQMVSTVQLARPIMPWPHKHAFIPAPGLTPRFDWKHVAYGWEPARTDAPKYIMHGVCAELLRDATPSGGTRLLTE